MHQKKGGQIEKKAEGEDQAFKSSEQRIPPDLTEI